MEKERKKSQSEANSRMSVEELQLIEQSLQNLMMQKQMFQMELVETTNALEELKKLKAKEEVFKIVGTIMIKSEKEDIEKELSRKKDLINMRITAIEKQEDGLKNKLIEKREEVLKTFKNH